MSRVLVIMSRNSESPQLPLYVDTHAEDARDVCRRGYVRVVCWQKEACIQIREDLVEQSQVMTFLASSRDEDNPSECIHLAHAMATLHNMRLVMEWLQRHIDFQSQNASDEDRLEFDRMFFLLNDKGKADYAAARTAAEKDDIMDSRKDWLRWRLDDPDHVDGAFEGYGGPNPVPFRRSSPVLERRHRHYSEIQQIMFLANFLELPLTEWHRLWGCRVVMAGVHGCNARGMGL